MKRFIFIYLLFLLPLVGFGQDWTQAAKLVAPDRAASDQLGTKVAISGDYAVATASGVGPNTGYAHVFKQENNNWVSQQKISFSDRENTTNDNRFGQSVAISGDYIIVGHTQGKNEFGTIMGAAYIYKLENGTWTEQQKIMASDGLIGNEFGQSVAIEGDYAVVGSSQQRGYAYIFKQENGVWVQQQKIQPAVTSWTNDDFGVSIDISGDYLVIGDRNHRLDANNANILNAAGAAFIYKLENGIWTEQQKIVAYDRASSDYFGYSVSISGDHIVVGAYLEDEDENLTQTLSSAGSAYIFKQENGVWVQKQKIVASDRAEGDRFGYSVSISGDHIVVGAHLNSEDENGENPIPNTGSAYIFKQEDGTWVQKQKIVAADRDVLMYEGISGHYFAASIAIDGERIIAGAYLDDHDENGENPITNAGAVYIFGICDITTPVLEAVEVCYGEEVTFTVTTEEGNTIKWYTGEDAAEPVFTGESFVIENATETTTYWVEAALGSWCVSGRIPVTVTVNPLPELTVANTAIETCEGTETLLTAATTEGNLVVWYNSPEATEWLHTGNEYTIPNLTETTSYWVQAYNTTTHCISERIEIVVTLLPAPALNIETTEYSVCSGMAAELFATSPSNVIFWYLNEDDTEYEYHGNLFVTDELTETTTYWVEAYNILTGCTSERIEVTVTVNPIPGAPIAVSYQTVEEGTTLADLDVDADGTLTWYANEALTIVLPETTLVEENTIYYVTQTIAGCESAATEVSVGFLGLADINGNSFAVYPNPTAGIVKIQSKAAVTNIEVFSISGQLVTSVKAANEVNISGYPGGTYVLRITLENGEVMTKKVVKK